MRFLFNITLVIFGLVISIFSQTARSIDTFGPITCGDFMNRMYGIYENEIKDNPENKIYVIYYEAQKRSNSIYNKKTKKIETVLKNPRFGDALNRAKEIPLFLKTVYKVPDTRIVLVDGGFKKNIEMEIWSVTNGAEVPKPRPTIERKDVNFAKGKPYKTRNLAYCYGELEKPFQSVNSLN